MTQDIFWCQVSDIQARGALITWSEPTRPESEKSTEEDSPFPDPLSFEVSISFTGKDGKYQSKYWWVQAAGPCRALSSRISQGSQQNKKTKSFGFPLTQWGRTQCNCGRPSTSDRLSRQVGTTPFAFISVNNLWKPGLNALLFLRVQAICNFLLGSPSEAVSFTTLSCEPDPPSPPRKASGNKNTLSLQWKVKKTSGLQ